MIDYTNKFAQIYKPFIEIIKSEIENIIGDNNNNIGIDCGDERIHIDCKNYSVSTIMVSDNKFYLSSPFGDKTYGFESLDFFREYIKQVIISEIKPKIIELYSSGYLETLPSNINYEFKFDISKLKGDWLIDKFNELAPNSETAENVNFVIDGGDVRIKFDIDCGRYGYWKGQCVRINERGNVRVDISDCPLEGNGLDDELMNAIIEQIKI